jgi:hypothetical protein
MRTKPPEIVEVTWVDSIGVPSVWESDECDPLSPSEIITVGYLWETTPEFLTICQSRSPTQVARRFSIPQGCIKNIKVIRK